MALPPIVGQMRDRYNQSAMGQLEGILGQARGAGAFDPRGNQLLRNQVRAHALRTARNRIARGGVLSRIMGLDPQQARVAQLGFEQGAGEDISNALNDADLRQGLDTQNWLRGLFGQQLGFEQNRALQAQAEKAQRKASGGLGGLVGGVVGAALPSIPFGNLFGGGGSRGGGGPRPPRLGESGFRY